MCDLSPVTDRISTCLFQLPQFAKLSINGIKTQLDDVNETFGDSFNIFYCSDKVVSPNLKQITHDCKFKAGKSTVTVEVQTRNNKYTTERFIYLHELSNVHKIPIGSSFKSDTNTVSLYIVNFDIIFNGSEPKIFDVIQLKNSDNNPVDDNIIIIINLHQVRLNISYLLKKKGWTLFEVFCIFFVDPNLLETYEKKSVHCLEYLKLYEAVIEYVNMGKRSFPDDDVASSFKYNSNIPDFRLAFLYLRRNEDLSDEDILKNLGKSARIEDVKTARKIYEDQKYASNHVSITFQSIS